MPHPPPPQPTHKSNLISCTQDCSQHYSTTLHLLKHALPKFPPPTHIAYPRELLLLERFLCSGVVLHPAAIAEVRLCTKVVSLQRTSHVPLLHVLHQLREYRAMNMFQLRRNNLNVQSIEQQEIYDDACIGTVTTRHIPGTVRLYVVCKSCQLDYTLYASHASGTTYCMQVTPVGLHTVCKSCQGDYTLYASHASGTTHCMQVTPVGLHTVCKSCQGDYTLYASHASGTTHCMQVMPVGLHTVCKSRQWDYTLYASHASGTTHCMQVTPVGLHTVCKSCQWDYTLYASHASGTTHCMQVTPVGLHTACK